LVTVLTPATTFTVEGNFSQKARAVNSIIINFSDPWQFSLFPMKMPEFSKRTPAFPAESGH
jgi:hypothetical protein